MVVIIIIAGLVVALLPQINEIGNKAGETATMARIQMLRAMIDQYANKTGDYPPSDFAKAEAGVKCKADETNSGIECLLIHLHQRSLGKNLSLEDKQDWLKNTDGDKNSVEIPLLKTKQKLEVVDYWQTPLAYFRSDSYKKPQEIVWGGDEGGEGETVRANAMKGDTGYLNSGKYQIISAGADGEFGTDDDISYPERVLK